MEETRDCGNARPGRAVHARKPGRPARRRRGRGTASGGSGDRSTVPHGGGILPNDLNVADTAPDPAPKLAQTGNTGVAGVRVGLPAASGDPFLDDSASGQAEDVIFCTVLPVPGRTVAGTSGMAIRPDSSGEEQGRISIMAGSGPRPVNHTATHAAIVLDRIGAARRLEVDHMPAVDREGRAAGGLPCGGA